jgi:hypothetical protein
VSGIESPDERIGKTVKALENSVSLFWLGGTEQHPIQESKVTISLPGFHRSLSNPLE